MEIFLGKYYYYLAGFIYDNSIYLNYYYYNSTNKNNVLHSSATGLKDLYYDYYYDIKNKGLSCQILKYQNSDTITCATYVYDSYYYEKYLASSFLSYNKNTRRITYKQDTIYYPWNEIMCIKSTYGHERSKAFFCLYLSSGEVNYFLFDIQADYSTLYYEKEDDYCKTEFYSLKVYYFPETEKYGISCITKTGKIQSIIYDKNMEKSYDTIYKYNGCISIYGHSLIYLKHYSNYYIVTDAICNGNYNLFEKLIEDVKEEEEEEREEEREEEEKEE